MKCPTDNIDLNEKQAEGFAYHECPDCQGLWMRHRALRTLVEKYSPGAKIAMPRPSDAYLPMNSPEYDTNDITKCPLDGSDYYEHAFGSVMIDICPNCDGIWLDKGELSKIRDELKNEEIPDTVVSTVINDIDLLFDEIGRFFSRQFSGSQDDDKGS